MLLQRQISTELLFLVIVYVLNSITEYFIYLYPSYCPLDHADYILITVYQSCILIATKNMNFCNVTPTEVYTEVVPGIEMPGHIINIL